MSPTSPSGMAYLSLHPGAWKGSRAGLELLFLARWGNRAGKFAGDQRNLPFAGPRPRKYLPVQILVLSYARSSGRTNWTAIALVLAWRASHAATERASLYHGGKKATYSISATHGLSAPLPRLSHRCSPRQSSRWISPGRLLTQVAPAENGFHLNRRLHAKVN